MTDVSNQLMVDLSAGFPKIEIRSDRIAENLKEEILHDLIAVTPEWKEISKGEKTRRSKAENPNEEVPFDQIIENLSEEMTQSLNAKNLDEEISEEKDRDTTASDRIMKIIWHSSADNLNVTKFHVSSVKNLSGEMTCDQRVGDQKTGMTHSSAAGEMKEVTHDLKDKKTMAIPGESTKSLNEELNPEWTVGSMNEWNSGKGTHVSIVEKPIERITCVLRAEILSTKMRADKNDKPLLEETVAENIKEWNGENQSDGKHHKL